VSNRKGLEGRGSGRGHRGAPTGGGPFTGHPRTQRQLQAGELLRHALVDVLAEGDLRDPVFEGVSITVGEVRCSPDLKQATVFVAALGAPLGGEVNRKLADALNKASAFVRMRLGRRVDMKFTPNLSFVADQSYDEATRVDALLRQTEVARDLTPPAGEP
jgi:ribosome-binding factor A